jgi:ABC-type transporter Mla MlaB component
VDLLRENAATKGDPKVKAAALPRRRRPVLEPVPPVAGEREPPGRRYRGLTITEEWCGPALVVAVGGEVDLGSAPVLRRVLDAARSRAPRRIVVDLSFVRFLDTAGLAVLLDAHRRAGHRRAAGGHDARDLASAAAHPGVRTLGRPTPRGQRPSPRRAALDPVAHRRRGCGVLRHRRCGLGGSAGGPSRADPGAPPSAD